ncbi:MAG: 6,7-dimethyl-8-ribityllumazine synthase [Chthoniobacterales bacterium]|nr:6,7-dimethyl-8-ribityllumazine synthase [Chthoniobacterales bacterium]
MATQIPERPRLSSKTSHRYAIVESIYNDEFVVPMAEAASNEIHAIEPTAKIVRALASGSFEIPVVAQALLEREKFDALIALGVILRGETAHADLIARAVTDALMRLSLDYKTPIIHEVLLLDNPQQAQLRCLDPQFNRGIEAARAAVNSVRILEEIRPPRTPINPITPE